MYSFSAKIKIFKKEIENSVPPFFIPLPTWSLSLFFGLLAYSPKVIKIQILCSSHQSNSFTSIEKITTTTASLTLKKLD